MTDQFPAFEPLVKKRGRAWTWCVCTTEGKTVMQGTEASRPGAKYQANRALFQLMLCAPYWSTGSGNSDRTGGHPSGRTRSDS